MAPQQKKLVGRFYSHGGLVFAIMTTDQPLDIRGCADLLRRTRALSSGQLGNVTLRLMEEPQFPSRQGYVIMTDRRGVHARTFENSVRGLFPGQEIDARRVTNFRENEGELFIALIFRLVLDAL